MEPRARIKPRAGKQLLCTARNCALVTDRPLESDGTDLGLDGELLKAGADAIRAAVTSGGVVSRVKLRSEIDVRIAGR